jgi:hypothetical protein
MFKIIYFALIISQMATECVASWGRTIDYETAWGEGKFSGETLKNVYRLESQGKKLTEIQKDFLIDSRSLSNLRYLDLKNQDIDDDFIDFLCGNSTFSRLIEIDLSDNPKLTPKSLEYFSQSPCIGSIRDLPQISARYELPSSEIRVYAQGTSIDPEVVKIYNSAPQNTDFFIRYLHPINNRKTSDPGNHAIKWIHVDLCK